MCAQHSYFLQCLSNDTIEPLDMSRSTSKIYAWGWFCSLGGTQHFTKMLPPKSKSMSLCKIKIINNTSSQKLVSNTIVIFFKGLTTGPIYNFQVITNGFEWNKMKTKFGHKSVFLATGLQMALRALPRACKRILTNLQKLEISHLVA